jgi:superfamily I DNA/RNA helicase
VVLVISIHHLICPVKRHLVLGGPGCGKTTRLLDIVADELASGVSPDKIAFVAFTNAAAEEAKKRAAERFALDPRRDLPWFRTIHSLAYAGCAIQRDEVIQRRDWVAFGNLIGEPMSGFVNKEDLEGGDEKPGDKLLRVVEYSRNTLTPLEDAWREMGDGVDYFRLIRFNKALLQWKAESGKIDFSDMISNFPIQAKASPVTVAVVDEAQDLTPSQWAVVQHAFGGVERLYIGGDDDQAIYRWAGADINYFLNFPIDHSEVLPVSHRLPEVIHDLAGKICKRISTRYPKPFTTTGRAGKIEHHFQHDGIDLSEPGSWLLLARNSYMLKEWERVARDQGYPYLTRKGSSVNPEHMTAIVAWEDWRKGKAVEPASLRVMMRALKRKCPPLNDARRYTAADLNINPVSIWHEVLNDIPMSTRAYYISCLRRGEKLTRTPRIRIDTIHGVKGGEADHVALMSDMSYRTHKSYTQDPDSEHRVFYVGVTRARHNLHIIEAQTQRSYQL